MLLEPSTHTAAPVEKSLRVKPIDIMPSSTRPSPMPAPLSDTLSTLLLAAPRLDGGAPNSERESGPSTTSMLSWVAPLSRALSTMSPSAVIAEVCACEFFSRNEEATCMLGSISRSSSALVA